MIGLKNLMTKETMRDKIERYGGSIEGEAEESKEFPVVVKDSIPLHLAVERISEWKDELEQMEEFSETFKFDDIAAKELNMRILNSKFGLCVVKKTQTVITKHPTGRNKFKVYGPIYNVENFALTGNTKPAPKDANSSMEEAKHAIQRKPKYLELVKKAVSGIEGKLLEKEASQFVINLKERHAH